MFFILFFFLKIEFWLILEAKLKKLSFRSFPTMEGGNFIEPEGGLAIWGV